MTTTTLHYLYDPLCGWCYASAPLVKAAREVISVIPHGGGMMSGAYRQNVTAQLREFVKPLDQRIAQVSGQPFGDAYLNGLLRDTTAVFDSGPPTAAILAAEAVAGRGLDMLAQLQIAHYSEGRRIADRAVLIDVAKGLGLDADTFDQALDHQFGTVLQAHFLETRALMARIGAQGFPSFALETNGLLQFLDVLPYLGRPQDFQHWLRGLTNTSAVTNAAEDVVEALRCGTNGCAI